MVLGWQLLRIRGHSMAPALQDGDYAVAKRLRTGEDLVVGDVVEIDHPDFGLIVKRVNEVLPRQVRVGGEAARSIDADQIGPIARARITARLVWRVSPRGLSRIKVGEMSSRANSLSDPP